MAGQERTAQNEFDALHGGAAPQNAARGAHFPRASFAHEVAAELGFDPAQLEARAQGQRPAVQAIEEQSHTRGPR